MLSAVGRLLRQKAKKMSDWPPKTASAIDVVKDIDLSGKCAIVTGCNVGIGYETVRALVHAGAQVTMACRNLSAAEEAKQRILKDFAGRGEPAIDLLRLDCASLASVDEFVGAYKASGRPLHILILNAGIYGAPERQTKDGFEITFQVNHLSQYHLARGLQDILVASAPARIVCVASEGHRGGPRLMRLFTENFDWSPADIRPERLSPPSERMNSFFQAYSISKLANVLTALGLNAELSESGVTAYSLHPGLVQSEVARSLGGFAQRAFVFAQNRMGKTTEVGASTSLVCAAHPRAPEHAGLYFQDNRPDAASRAGQSLENAAKLREVSDAMIAEWKARQ